MPAIAANAIIAAIGVAQGSAAALAVTALTHAAFAAAASDIGPVVAPPGEWTPEADHDRA